MRTLIQCKKLTEQVMLYKKNSTLWYTVFSCCFIVRLLNTNKNVFIVWIHLFSAHSPYFLSPDVFKTRTIHNTESETNHSTPIHIGSFLLCAIGINPHEYLFSSPPVLSHIVAMC